MTSELNVRELTPELNDIIIRFNSGNSYLDNFIKYGNALDDNVGKTYVLLSKDSKMLVGYYNITAGSLEIVESGIHVKIGGCVHLNCIALDKSFQKNVEHKLGDNTKIYTSDLLLRNCVKRVMTIRRENLGVSFITLNSTYEGENLYLRHNFQYLEEDMFFAKEEADMQCIQMYLPLGLNDL